MLRVIIAVVALLVVLFFVFDIRSYLREKKLRRHLSGKVIFKED